MLPMMSSQRLLGCEGEAQVAWIEPSRLDLPDRRWGFVTDGDGSTMVCPAIPALPARWRRLDSGSPRVPSPSPSWASEVVMQYRMENPYSREAIGPTLSADWSAQLISRHRYLPSGCSAS